MAKSNLSPFDPRVTQAIIDRIRQMTPEERHAFFTYRDPDVPETDMTGMYSSERPERTKKPRKAASA